jgi:CheY-like chemotaxis protein
MTRLLAIDDDSDSAELIARIAIKCGYEAQSMTDPRELRRVLEDWKPDVFTLDLYMPEKDGITIISLLREIEFKGTLIITSAQDELLRDAAWNLAKLNGIKVTPHLQKPIILPVLRDMLNGLQLVS